MKKIFSGILLSLLLLMAGCATSATETAGSGDGKLKVVATTTMLTDLVEQIGGEHVEVEGLMGPGIDPHGYQASSSDVEKLAEADVVAYNGLHLEGQMGEVFDNLEKQNKEIIVLEEAIPTEHLLESEDASMNFDPHIWFSTSNWKIATDYVVERLITLDPANEEYYAANGKQYQSELTELDQYIKDRIKEIPEESRYLVTAHDAFQYFGNEYAFNVIGLQGLNSQTEIGTRDISELAEFIAEQKIKAIFVESSVSSRTIESLQAAIENLGWKVEIGGELYSDALGDSENNAETYLKMYQANIDTIINALK